jgi:hypothetical protein
VNRGAACARASNAAAVQSTRYLFVLPGSLRHACRPSPALTFRDVSRRLTGDGQIGLMEKMDGKNPTLSLPLPGSSKLVRPRLFVTVFHCCFSVSTSRRCCVVPSFTPKHRLLSCSCLRKAAALYPATRLPAALRAKTHFVLMFAPQVFNSIVVFSEGYVEDESGARVPLPPDFLKTGAAAADAFNDLPRTCEKVPVIKRSAEEDNDNERYDRAWPLIEFCPRCLRFVTRAEVTKQTCSSAPAAGWGRRQTKRRAPAAAATATRLFRVQV